MTPQQCDIAVIGGGAAGFFAAITAAAQHPGKKVLLLEKTGKLLSKVKVSGGGRCNVTHHCFDNKTLASHYPRGAKALRTAFGQFSVADTINWFAARGVELKTEADGRMFPVTNDSQTIVDCLVRQSRQYGISIHTHTAVRQIKPVENGFLLETGDAAFHAAAVIVAAGGSPGKEGLQWLADLGHAIEHPVPSLFTFNMPAENTQLLMGVSVPQARVKVLTTALQSEGPLLITHWGMSGPAVLKLSAWGARTLHEMGYRFRIAVNWTGAVNEEKVREQLLQFATAHPKKQLLTQSPFDQLPTRLWEHLLIKSMENVKNKTWGETGKNQLNKLVNTLFLDEYAVQGKTTFKEEFVTCGGISLGDVDISTMQSKKVPGLYFAGEVLDIDGITGGFNFQAAWTTGYIAGKSCL